MLFDGFYHYSWGIFLKFRWPAFLFMLYFFVMSISTLRLYWVEYRRPDRNKTKQRRAQAFLIAFGIGYLGTLDFLPAIGVPYYPLSSVPMICMLILVARAIWRYRLVDITPAFAAREIIDTMNDGLIVLDADKVVRLVNQATCSLLGYQEEDLIGKRPVDGMAACGELAEQLESIIGDSTVRNREVDCRTNGNGSRTLSLSTSVMRNPAGERVATVCMVNDITEQKRSEESLLLFRNLLDHSNDAIFVNDPTGRFLMVNNKACSSLGYGSEELLSLTTLDIETTFPDQRSWEAHVREVQRRGHLIAEGVQKRSDGSPLPVEVSVTYMTAGNRDYMVALARDITDRKRAEAERERLIAQLQEANEKLQSLDIMKTNFISMVSHELRTPLTSIKAFVELLLMKQAMPEEKKMRLMSTISVETDRLARLITDLLDLARIEAGSMKWQLAPVSLEDLIRTVITSMEALFENKGLRVTTAFSPSLSPVPGAYDRLVQVVTNILSNAVKFTPHGGAIHIAVRQENDPMAQVVVEISDTGIGIPTADLDLIFEKFHRSIDPATASIEGTGLGLAISRQIVEHHGGRIWATSTRGKGSTFTFTVPLLAEPLLRS